MDYYELLHSQGCEIDSHESDLYVKATPLAINLTQGAPNRSFFKSWVDNETWIEVPFAYTPWWQHRAKGE